MQPGRELDLEIGKRIIKVMIIMDNNDGEYKVVSPRSKRPGLLPHYSTRMEHAHMLVEFLQHKGFFCNYSSVIKDGETRFRCAFTKDGVGKDYSLGMTLEHAIALAALNLTGQV